MGGSGIHFAHKGKGESVDLLVIAGEHSGDEHASALVEEVLKRNPHLKIAAIGGSGLRDLDVEFLFDLTAYSVVGFVEVLKHYKKLKSIFDETIKWIQVNKPRAICFVDYPGFNLKVARTLYKVGLAHKAGGNIQLLYYISPQIWAWKAKRRFMMSKVLDAMAVIFPFEKECYKDTQLPVTFVGHPFVSKRYQSQFKYDPLSKNILLLPGSRLLPIKRILPVLLKTFELHLKKYPEDKAVIIYPNEVIKKLCEKIVEKFSTISSSVVLQSNRESVTAKAVLSSSGTMSFKCVLAALPGVVVYKAHPLTYWMGRQLVKVNYLGIGNILLNKNVYPEFIQHKADPKILIKALDELLHNVEKKEAIKVAAQQLKDMLSQAECSPTEWLLGYLNNYCVG